MSLLSDLDLHVSMKRDLIILKKNSKEPRDLNWIKINYNIDVLKKAVLNGHNIGWRLGPKDLILDVDPRHNQALISLKRLTQHLNLKSLSDICPTVHTGGHEKGRHFYFKKRNNQKLKTKTSEYPDLEFLSQGRYVLIPGCIHPETKRHYSWNFFSPSKPGMIPDWLETSLLYYQKSDNDDIILPLEIIKECLSYIPIKDFRDYNDWLRIGMSIHSASGGDPEAEQLWIDWSTSDPLYANAEKSAEGKWESFKNTGITANTLVKIAIDYGYEVLHRDFDEPWDIIQDTSQRLKELLHRIQTQDSANIRQFVVDSLKFPENLWDKIRFEIKNIHGVRFASLDNLRKKLQNRKKSVKKESKEKKKNIDAAVLIADKLINDKFASGNHIVHAQNQCFYAYRKTHWEMLLPNIVDKYIYDTAENFKEIYSDLNIKSSTLFSRINKVLIAKSAKQGDIFRFQKDPPSVINTKNVEIWIKKEGGIDIRNHSPESYLLTCLETSYNPDATCEIFDSALNEIFLKNKEPNEIIRHFWEFTGYILQPYKNIPTWWIWHGYGENGKSTLIEILQHILGNAVLPRPISNFNDAGNAHAIASLVGKLLVIDDEADSESVLPTSALKKLAESKLWESNPKHKDAFVFRSCATPLLLSNGWPGTRDLSRGLLRKTYIIPFKRTFDKRSEDVNLKYKIVKTELPGILNKALIGYQRLRQRSFFDEPQECKDIKIEWLKYANPFFYFLDEALESGNESNVITLSDLYASYRSWCHMEGGVKYVISKQQFEINMIQQNHPLVFQKNKKVFRNIKYKKEFDNL